MSIVRITTVTLCSETVTDTSVLSYAAKAPNEFPSAEQLIWYSSRRQ